MIGRSKDDYPYGLNGNDLRRMERALCTLADYEGPIDRALTEECGGSERDLAAVFRALHWMVDGE